MKKESSFLTLTRSRKKWLLLISIIALIGFIIHNHTSYQRNEGTIFGTTYHITYESRKDLHTEILQELKKVDATLSMFNDTSLLTRINRNEEIKLNDMFLTVFHRAMEIAQTTDGAFDITIAPLVNIWGFGFEAGSIPTQTQIDSLRQFTGFRKIRLEHGQILKDDPRIRIDFSAIAKGYGVDAIARLLETKGAHNFMVEIGGEVHVKGKSPIREGNSKRLWRIGINKPVEDSLSTDISLQTILKLTDCGMATSGNYRNFYYKDGIKYAHTIDPGTGYPVEHSLLSATVIANDCMTADAYATAFMVMGLEKSIGFIKEHKNLHAYFIYSTPDGSLKTWSNQPLN